MIFGNYTTSFDGKQLFSPEENERFINFCFWDFTKSEKLAIIHKLSSNAPVAQWIEHRIPVPRVGGSSPFRCTKKTRYRMVPGLFAYCRMGAKGRPDRRAGKKCPVDTFLVHGRVQRRKTAFCRSAGFLIFVYVGALERSSKRDPFAVPGGNFACRSRLASCRPLHTLRPRLLCHRQRSGSRPFRCTATARAKHNPSCPILLLVVS